MPDVSARSRRTVALPAVAVTALRAHRMRQLEARLAAGGRCQDGGFVFTSSIGTPLEPRNVTRKFKALLTAAKLPWLLTSIGFRLYLQYMGAIGAVYGAIGSVVVLLPWFYLTGLAILIGAELNADNDRALPSRDDQPQGPHRRKKTGPAAEKAQAAQR